MGKVRTTSGQHKGPIPTDVASKNKPNKNMNFTSTKNLSEVAKNSKSIKKMKNRNKTTKLQVSEQSEDDDREEALDFDTSGQEDGLVVDQQEISDFVSKLGLNKFNIHAPSGNGKVANDKPTKNKKSPLNEKKKADSLVTFTAPVQNKKMKGNTSSTSEEHTQFPKSKADKKKLQKANKKAKLQETRQKNPQDGQKQKGTPQTKIIVRCEGKWFADEEDKSTGNKPEETQEAQSSLALRKDEFSAIQTNANNLFSADITAYIAVNNSGSNKFDFKWTEKMMKTGTLPDRMAAYVVRIQDSPVHNLQYLQQLISMVKIQGKQQCMMTADTLRDLFLEDLLPPDRKLIQFSSRSGELRDASKKQLIKWTFEDRLKNHYASYIEALKKMAGDTVEKLRGKAIAIMHQLLVAHPEQEETLLQVLVNKLGDPQKKLGSRALFYLNKLLEEHPRMKLVVVEEVERLIFRNNISKRAQYYGICFLNLVNLKDEHPSLAHKLITIYVAFFKAGVKTGDIDTKMMSGLLTGINRAFPQAREFGFQFTENLDTLYRIVQLSQFTISVQAMCILFQITDVVGNPEGADRFYRVLYEKLLTPEFLTSAHNVQFLNLVFRSVKSDNNVNRVTAFLKRLLQISQNSSPNLACAILFILSEVTKAHPRSLKLGNLSENEGKIDEKTDADLSSDSNDDENESVDAKREKSSNLQKLMKSSNITVNPTNEEAGEENQIAQKSRVSSLLLPTNQAQQSNTSVVITDESNVTVTIPEAREVEMEDIKPDVKKIITEYSPVARNPSYCGAELTFAYELTALAKHFHPSVSLFAQSLLKRKAIKYDGDPMRDFTLTRFLERFSYRNAKTNKSNNHPQYHPKGLRNIPVNSETYLQTDEESIPVEERFFYRFFKTKKEKATETDDDDKDDESDAESVGDDEFDDMMKNYFKTSGAVVSDDETDDEGDEGEDNYGVDYSSGFASSSKGKKRKQDDDEDESGEDEDGNEESDGDDDADDFISMDNEDDDFGESEDEMDLDDDEMSLMSSNKRKSKKMSGEDLFAPAEEFAEMLEDNAEEGFAGSQTLVNRDRSDPKQLKWEVEKDRWMKGYSNKSKNKFKNNNYKKFKGRK